MKNVFSFSDFVNIAPEKEERQEELVQCPFNAAHVMQEDSLLNHVNRCKDRSNLFRLCTYNKSHYFHAQEIQQHMLICPDRSQFKALTKEQKRELEAIQKNPPVFRNRNLAKKEKVEAQNQPEKEKEQDISMNSGPTEVGRNQSMSEADEHDNSLKNFQFNFEEEMIFDQKNESILSQLTGKEKKSVELGKGRDEKSGKY